MNNILTYLFWRGDLSFLENHFNDVDNLILCAFTYLKLDTLFKTEDILSIEAICKKYTQYTHENQKKLVNGLRNSKRFKDIKVAKYVNVLDTEEEKQFKAMTFILPDHTLYIAFSGTSDDLVAWKEDFNLSFMSVIPSQKDALQYVNDILLHTKKNVYIGGHSKGGNLALFSSIYLDKSFKNQILKVYNNDGPGLDGNAFLGAGFKSIHSKIITYIPKSSIVGNIFINKTKTEIVKSNALGILSHDLFSWEVDKDFIVTLEKKDKKVSQTINHLLDKIPKEKRKIIINIIYEVLEHLNITSFDDFLKNYAKLDIKDLDTEDIAILLEISRLIFKLF